MIKKLFLVFIAISSSAIYAQESVYSFYGIGSQKFKGTVENRSMGGLSIIADSIHVNLQNPASYATENLEGLPFNGETRPVKFTVGGSYTSTKIKSDSGSDRAEASTFDYLALSIPVGKFGFGFGLLPNTSVGYKLQTFNGDNNPQTQFSGDGGLNTTYFSLAYRLAKGLSIGADVRYNFGTIDNKTIEYAYDSEGNILQYQTREQNESELSGLNLNIGLTYERMISDKLKFSSGITITPENKITSRNSRALSTITINASTGQEFVVNTIDTDLGNLAETDYTLPAKYSFGAGIGQPNKWFAGVDYTTQSSAEYEAELYNYQNTTFTSSSTIAFGGYFIPQYNSFTSYWKRVVYRAGLRFENTGLQVSGEDINEFGISFGMGLPVGNLFSNANIGIEYGSRGTTNKNLVKENFIGVNLSLSLNDRWFQKRKYN